LKLKLKLKLKIKIKIKNVEFDKNLKIEFSLDI
jgi:hypothetical protein